MANSVKEKIALELASRVDDVTIGNGYAQSLSVKRPNAAARDIAPDNHVAVILQGEHTRFEDLDAPGNPNAIGWRAEFWVVVFARPSEADTVPIEQRLNNLEADVMKAIAADGADWHTMDGNAIETEFTGAEQFEHDSGAYDGIIIFLDVFYRHRFNDPYTAA